MLLITKCRMSLVMKIISPFSVCLSLCVCLSVSLSLPLSLSLCGCVGKDVKLLITIFLNPTGY